MTKPYTNNHNRQTTMKGITFGFVGASVFFVGLSIKFLANSDFVPAALLCFIGLGMLTMALLNHRQRSQESSIAGSQCE